MVGRGDQDPAHVHGGSAGGRLSPSAPSDGRTVIDAAFSAHARDRRTVPRTAASITVLPKRAAAIESLVGVSIIVTNAPNLRSYDPNMGTSLVGAQEPAEAAGSSQHT